MWGGAARTRELASFFGIGRRSQKNRVLLGRDAGESSRYPAVVLSRENGLATVMYDVDASVMTHDLGALSWSPLTGEGGTKRKLELQPSAAAPPRRSIDRA